MDVISDSKHKAVKVFEEFQDWFKGKRFDGVEMIIVDRESFRGDDDYEIDVTAKIIPSRDYFLSSGITIDFVGDKIGMGIGDISSLCNHLEVPNYLFDRSIAGFEPGLPLPIITHLVSNLVSSKYHIVLSKLPLIGVVGSRVVFTDVGLQQKDYDLINKISSTLTVSSDKVVKKSFYETIITPD